MIIKKKKKYINKKIKILYLDHVYELDLLLEKQNEHEKMLEVSPT